MSPLKQYRVAEKATSRQKQVIADLEALTKSIERCEQTVADLKVELEALSIKHQSRTTTQEDIAYLTDLLKCAHKKLGWEKQLASLKKRTPPVLEEITALMNDPANPPTDQMGANLLRALQGVQSAMERLENLRVK